MTNNWDDVNSYFSMGKAIFNGRIPYRDIFDQKGMYLYFLYGLAYLISNTTFIGVFILEILIGFADILGFYKILSLYLKDSTAAILAPLPFAFIVSSRSFWWGGSAEELCLPLYIWGLFIILMYLRLSFFEKVMSYKYIFIGGILAGIVANIKFTGLGFFFAWMAIVWISFLVHKEFVNSIKACIVFLTGMFVTFIPWIIYFAVNNALYDWYWGYVYINVFLYPNESQGGLFGRIYLMAKILYWLIYDNFIYFMWIIPGFLFTLFEKNKKFLERICVIVLFAFLFTGIFIGCRELSYYSLPLSVFSVFGFALVGKVVDFVIQKNLPIKSTGEATANSVTRKGLMCIKYVMLNALALIMIYNASMNVSFLSETKDNYFMYRFRDEVLQSDNPTLLNIGCLDAGLYTLTGIVPSCRWFQTQTLDIPEKENNPYYEQDRYIKEALTEYVLARDYYPKFIYDNYSLIDQADYSYSGYDFTFYLFKRN